jgi:hypothetical protein
MTDATIEPVIRDIWLPTEPPAKGEAYSYTSLPKGVNSDILQRAADSEERIRMEQE